MSKLRTIGWSVSERGDCFRKHLECLQAKQPVIAYFSGQLNTKCEHNHEQTFRNDLVILEKSGWLFTYPPSSVIQEKLIVTLLQGLFTIDMLQKGREVEIGLVNNGVINEESFKNYVNKVYNAAIGREQLLSLDSENQKGWEILADLISSLSICHRIGKRGAIGVIPCILFPSLLPKFGEEGACKDMWDILKKQGKKQVTRTLIVAGKYGDKGKVMEFISSSDD